MLPQPRASHSADPRCACPALHCWSRELFYYEAEHRRLEHIAARNRDAAADGSPRTKKASLKAQQKAVRKLEWERQWLAAQLKWYAAAPARPVVRWALRLIAIASS